MTRAPAGNFAPARCRALRAWYARRPGCLLETEELAQLADILPNLFGYHLLQIGAYYTRDCLETSRIRHCVVMDADLHEGRPGVDTGRPRVAASADALPFGGDSLDVLVLPHTLELSPNPHQVLREADRVLIAEGHVVVLGFNPWAPWMLARWMMRRQPPWCGRFISQARLRDWFQLLGFDIVLTTTYFFRPPLPSQSIMDRLGFLDRWGKRWWPFFGGAYVMVAKKRVATLTPIRPRWRPRRSRLGAPGYVEHTGCDGAS